MGKIMILDDVKGRLFMQKYGKRVKEIKNLLADPKIRSDKAIVGDLVLELLDILETFEKEVG